MGTYFQLNRPYLLGSNVNVTPPPYVVMEEQRNESVKSIFDCDPIDYKYNLTIAIICGCVIPVGLFITCAGYRFLKFTNFCVGFIFGALITYMICSRENLFAIEGNIGISVGAGVLLGIVTGLVVYVGIFSLGFHLGIVIAMVILIALEQYYHPSTLWLPVGIIFGCALFMALLNLYSSRKLSIFSSTVYGATVVLAASDYFVEKFKLTNYCIDRVGADFTEYDLCWISWTMLGTYPIFIIVGIVTQCTITAKDVKHSTDIRATLRRKRASRTSQHQREQPNSSSGRSKRSDRRRNPRHTESERKQAKYKHLYRIRRLHGDVISQECMETLSQAARRTPCNQSLSSIPMTETSLERPHYPPGMTNLSTTLETTPEDTLQPRRSANSTRKRPARGGRRSGWGPRGRPGTHRQFDDDDPNPGLEHRVLVSYAPPPYREW